MSKTLFSDGKTDDDFIGMVNGETCINLLDDISCLKEDIDTLRGQLQNCVNYLHRAKNGGGRRSQFEHPIESANKALTKTL